MSRIFPRVSYFKSRGCIFNSSLKNREKRKLYYQKMLGTLSYLFFYIFGSLTTLSIILSTIGATDSTAEILPEEVLILANSSSEDSLSLAIEYSKARGIPSKNIISVKTSFEDSISRESFYLEIVLPLKEALNQLGLQKPPLVLAVMYGMPLWIREVNPKAGHNTGYNGTNSLSTEANSTGTRKLQQRITQELSQQCDKTILTLHSLQNKLGSPAFSEQKLEKTNVATLWKDTLKVAETLQNNKGSSPLKPADLQKELQKFLNEIISPLFGLSAAHTLVRSDKTAHDTIKDKISKLEREAIHALNSKSLPAFAKASSTLVGCIGALQRIHTFNHFQTAKDSSASIDSELVLLAGLPYNIPISSRIPNPLFWSKEMSEAPKPPMPLLMVSRLDGPTPAHVRKLIKDTIQVEESRNFSGTVLIDSQGKPWSDRSEIGNWDHELTLLARENFGDKLRVKDDTSPELAEKTEDIAIYLGWYRVRNYEDSYSYAKGAVGYHIASYEGVGIHDPMEKGWCKNMLERGVVATVGAIDEPYLDSFPDPKLFLSSLLSGRYHLVESYFLASKYVGWRMILFGDPLYKPIASPALALKRNIGITEALPSALRTLSNAPSTTLRNMHYPANP